jgi:hypothetical protein
MNEAEILEAMQVYGGGFVQALSRAYRAADADNRKKLRDAFPEVFSEYAGIARLHYERSVREGR